MRARQKQVGRLFTTVFCLLFVVLTSSTVAFATERTADEVSRITRQLSQEIYSPYCPGKTLAMCPSGNALQARMEIQEMAAGGMSEEEIKTVILERYGEEYALVEPPARDNLTLLGGILAGLAIAVLAVGALARRRLHSGVESEVELPGEDNDDLPGDTDGYLDELRSEYTD